MRSKLATVQRKVSLPVISSCHDCHWFGQCGGYRGQPDLFANSCFARHCCGGEEGCNYLCPANPNFTQMCNEVEGLRFDLLPEFRQCESDLPKYIPALLNRSCRRRLLEVPIVAIPVEQILKVKRQHMVAIASTADGLREYLRLGSETRIIMNCIRQDDPIERLWEYWLQDNVPMLLRTLGIEWVIAPNFSHLQGVPRLESIGNRMRQLICARGFLNAGVNTVPHLSVVDPQDWDFWRNWLIANPTVKIVAFEFETGYKKPVEGYDALKRIAQLQNDIGRNMHLIVVGGTQYRFEVPKLFFNYTFIDGSPFCNTFQRQRARLSGGELAWGSNPTAKGEPLDDLMLSNFCTYSAWMDASRN